MPPAVRAIAEADRAAVGVIEISQQSQQSTLPASAATDDGEKLSGRHVQIKICQYGLVAKAPRQSTCREW